jgi:drug/metabolite transporter (DMT)-like permease
MWWFWPEQPLSATAWAAMAAVALLCTALAYILFFRIIAKAGPSKALTVTFLVPVFALLYGSLFLNETITLWMVLCGVVIMAGTSLATGLVRIKWLERRA